MLRLEVLNLTRNQPLVASVNPLDTYAVVDRRACDGSYRSVHPWGIST